ncbi:SGNH/GDSL hydrolase family protein [Nocardioides sp. LHG3406-4]|uniref:SGNH/GDSL hydrolase family protein n=1 Tax=Nocardioides sp. LHG3406-4 TaxID=2804575 RepID=UPI003CF71F39
MTTSTVVLYGDSMLGRFTKPRIDALEQAVGVPATVLNCAAGGWNSADCARRAPALAPLRPDLMVLSLGSNDCAPWKQVPVDAFADHVTEILAAFSHSYVVGLLPPVILEVDRPGLGRRRNADLDRYREVLRAKTEGCVEVDRILAGVTRVPTLEADGLHLTSSSYDLVVPALADAMTVGLRAATGRA